jgi:hypothetical protein
MEMLTPGPVTYSVGLLLESTDGLDRSITRLVAEGWVNTNVSSGNKHQV